MHTYDVTVSTSASPEIVWKLLVNAASWPLWSKVDSLDTTRSVGLDPGGSRPFRTIEGHRAAGELRIVEAAGERRRASSRPGSRGRTPERPGARRTARLMVARRTPKLPLRRSAG